MKPVRGFTFSPISHLTFLMFIKRYNIENTIMVMADAECTILNLIHLKAKRHTRQFHSICASCFPFYTTPRSIKLNLIASCPYLIKNKSRRQRDACTGEYWRTSTIKYRASAVATRESSADTLSNYMFVIIWRWYRLAASPSRGITMCVALVRCFHCLYCRV